VIPLFPLLGVERDAVLRDLFRQMEEIRALLDGGATAPMAPAREIVPGAQN
jgi:hypothetical protein